MSIDIVLVLLLVAVATAWCWKEFGWWGLAVFLFLFIVAGVFFWLSETINGWAAVAICTLFMVVCSAGLKIISHLIYPTKVLSQVHDQPTGEYFIVNDGGLTPLALGDVSIFASKGAAESALEIYDVGDPKLHVFTSDGQVYEIVGSLDGRCVEYVRTDVSLAMTDFRHALLCHFIDPRLAKRFSGLSDREAINLICEQFVER